MTKKRLKELKRLLKNDLWNGREADNLSELIAEVERLQFELTAKNMMIKLAPTLNNLAKQEFVEGFNAETAELIRQIALKDEKIKQLAEEVQELKDLYEANHG